MSCCFSVPTSQFSIFKDWQDNSSISPSVAHLLWTWIKCDPCSSWLNLYYKLKPRLLRNTDHMLKITLLLNNVTEHISLLPSLWQLKYTFNHCHKIQYMRCTKRYTAKSTKGESTSEYNKKRNVWTQVIWNMFSELTVSWRLCSVHIKLHSKTLHVQTLIMLHNIRCCMYLLKTTVYPLLQLLDVSDFCTTNINI